MALKLQPFALVNGVVAHTTVIRSHVVAAMAKHLIEHGAVDNESDAMRSLMGSDEFSPFDVLVLVPDARQVAMQEIVAAEMSKP